MASHTQFHVHPRAEEEGHETKGQDIVRDVNSNLSENLQLSPPKVNRTSLPYPTGRKSSFPIPPLPLPPRPKSMFPLDGLPENLPTLLLSIPEKSLVQTLLYIIANTHSHTHAWTAYSSLLELHRLNSQVASSSSPSFPEIHISILRRLAKILSRQKPKTRGVFLRLLQVLTHIRAHGFLVRRYEWNALADNAGKGWRKVSPQDYKLALGIFEDMISGLRPGDTNARSLQRAGQLPGSMSSKFHSSRPFVHSTINPDTHPSDGHTPQLDIVSYTTLLNLAAATRDPAIFAQAKSLLDASGLQPDRIAHLTMLKYYSEIRDARGVRRMLDKMYIHNHELGIDGLNACIWSFTLLKRLDIVESVYQVLRWRARWEAHVIGLSLSDEQLSMCMSMSPEQAASHPSSSQTDRDEALNVHELRASLGEEHQLWIHPMMKPDMVTYTMVIQAFAFHGDFRLMVTVLMDMLETENNDYGAPLVLASDSASPSAEGVQWKRGLHSPSMAIFRAIFLGFANHAVPPSDTGDSLPMHSSSSMAAANTVGDQDVQAPPAQLTPHWNLRQLQQLFDLFLSQSSLLHSPPDEVLQKRIIYWIMSAFRKASGYDKSLMLDALERLEERFGTAAMPTVGKNHRLWRMRQELEEVRFDKWHLGGVKAGRKHEQESTRTKKCSKV